MYRSIHWTGLLDWNTGLTFESKFKCYRVDSYKSTTVIESYSAKQPFELGMVRIGMAPGGAPILLSSRAQCSKQFNTNSHSI